MKKFLKIIILLIIMILIYFNYNNIQKTANQIISMSLGASTPSYNEYAKKENYDYLQITNNFSAQNKKHLYNIIYTYLDSGMSKFNFKCDIKYENCIKDLEELINQQIDLTIINYYVHPFNSFAKINFKFNSLGIIEAEIIHNYNQDDINFLNNQINNIVNKLNLNEVYKYSKIDFVKSVHDYIINNTIYDKDSLTNKNNIHLSSTALGPLKYGKAICSGYADTMSLFLHKFNIKNYKLASDNHAWNGVYINKTWRHLDLTWDDPISSDGQNVLSHKYFLIDTTSLHRQDLSEHNFNKEIYKEFAK